MVAFSNFPIADMHVFPLTREAGRLTLLRNSDHLLRRFGQLDMLDLAAGQRSDLAIRGEADRFLFAIDGRLKIAMLDVRTASPTFGARAELSLSAEQPQGVLVPFGVACLVAATTQARLIQLSTHSEPHPADRAPSADELKLLTD